MTNRLARFVRVACWVNLGLVLFVWPLFRFAADRWWPATVLIYGPRWIYGVPSLLLAPALVYFRPKRLSRYRFLLVIASIIAVFPIMGCCIPPPFGHREAPSDQVFHLLSANVDGNNMDPAAMFRLINTLQPDAIACEEWSPQEAVSPC